MSDIVMKSNENVCEDTGLTRKSKYLSKTIGSVKIWYKFCPSCGIEQQYTAKRSIWKAVKENRVCYSCKNKGNNNPFFGKSHSQHHRKNLSENQKKCSYRYKKLGHNPPKIKLVCKKCGKNFEVINSRKERKYCSYICALKDAFGFADGHKTIPELRAECIFKELGISFQYGYALGGKVYDFYLPTKNLLVEIDGIYWHGKGLSFDQMNNTQRSNYLNDLKKVEIAKKNGYHIIRIWEDELEVKFVSECVHR